MKKQVHLFFFKISLFLVTLICLLGSIIVSCSASKGSEAKPGVVMKDIKEYGEGLFAEMKTTKGTMLIKLFYDKVPLTIANFVGLAEGTKDSIKGVGVKYYDGLTFHRVIPNFMIQGGDPAGNGTGGPGYSFEDEFDATLRHDKKGILSMANAGPNSNGSQFFITHVPTAWLDGKHTVFGEVVFGLDVVDAVQMGDKIESVVIHRNGDDVKNYKITQKEFDSIRKKVLSK